MLKYRQYSFSNKLYQVCNFI